MWPTDYLLASCSSFWLFVVFVEWHFNVDQSLWFSMTETMVPTKIHSLFSKQNVATVIGYTAKKGLLIKVTSWLVSHRFHKDIVFTIFFSKAEGGAAISVSVSHKRKPGHLKSFLCITPLLYHHAMREIAPAPGPEWFTWCCQRVWGHQVCQEECAWAHLGERLGWKLDQARLDLPSIPCFHEGVVMMTRRRAATGSWTCRWETQESVKLSLTLTILWLHC